MSFRAAMIQFDTAYMDVGENISRMSALIDEAASPSSPPDLIVMPELWTSGYSEEIFRDIRRFAQPADGKAVAMLREKARRYGVWIAGGSMVELAEDGIYNTCFLINRQGQIAGHYRKMHLYSAMIEDKAFRNGTEMPVFETDLGRIALMTCYDIRFVEMSRDYAMCGVEALVVVSNWAKPKLNHWRVLLQARAIENQVALLACNRVGTAGNCTYFGHSLALDPWGEFIAEDESEKETILRAEVDLGRVAEVRRKIPMYLDRQPASYTDRILSFYDGRTR